jgi:hypothetical protein
LNNQLDLVSTCVYYTIYTKCQCRINPATSLHPAAVAQVCPPESDTPSRVFGILLIISGASISGIADFRDENNFAYVQDLCRDVP